MDPEMQEILDKQKQSLLVKKANKSRELNILRQTLYKLENEISKINGGIEVVDGMLNQIMKPDKKLKDKVELLEKKKKTKNSS